MNQPNVDGRLSQLWRLGVAELWCLATSRLRTTG